MDANSSASDACFYTLWRQTLRPVDVGSQCVLCRPSVVPHSFLCSVLTSEVLSSSSQLLLQCAALCGPHSFFCSVLPSKVLTASSAVCYSLRSSQLLLQCAALWDPHSFFFSVLLFAVPTAFSAVCCPLAVSGHAVKWEDTLIECAAVSGLPDHNHTEQLRCALSLQCPVLRLRQKRDVCSAQPRW